MDKENVVYILSGLLLSHKKNNFMTSARKWMDLGTIMLSEINQSLKAKGQMIRRCWLTMGREEWRFTSWTGGSGGEGRGMGIGKTVK